MNGAQTLVDASKRAPGQADVTQRSFRDALGAFVTGVVVVTTRGRDGRPVGLTVNSFNSVSLDPPLVLWSLSLRSPSLDAFRKHPFFGVSVLAAGQRRLCEAFSRPSANKFLDIDHFMAATGVAMLAGAAAHFECRCHTRHIGGDHEIYIGEVVSYEDHGREPLVFHRGGLRILQSH